MKGTTGSRRHALPVARALCFVLLLMGVAGGAWAQNAMSAFRIDEQVAHFNRHTGEFWAPEEVNVSVDYNYTGNQGTPVFVGVEAWSGGNRDTRFGYAPARINSAGRGRAAPRLSALPDRMPLMTQPVVVDRLRFKMYRGGQEAFLTWDLDVRIVFTTPYERLTRDHVVALEPSGGAASTPPAGTAASAPPAASVTLQPGTIRTVPELRLPGQLVALAPRRLSGDRWRVLMDTQHILLAGKTNQGRYYVALAEHMQNSDLILRKWKVFAPNGSVHRQGTNTRVRRTFALDLDTGANNIRNARDFWWQFATETERYIHPQNGAQIAVAYFSRANFPVNAPPAKRVFLELDKIQGADWAPYVVERGGARHSMESIYADANIDLRLHSHNGNITDLKNGAAYSRAELDSFFSSNFNATAPSGYWHMHGAMMTRYTNSGVLGIMYRTGDRRGFALFAGAFSGANREAFMLRTTAHELGHAVNLFHSDGNANNNGSPVGGQGRTIMNQTWTLANDWGYTWHTNSMNHLNNHPVNRIQPNTGHGFDQCISTHRAQY